MRVLIAARLSQLASGQTGLDTQDIEATKWARDNGHTIVHVAADTKSGTSAPWDRPSLRPWVSEDDKLAQYDGVLALKLDRLSRGDNASTNAIEDWSRRHGKLLLTADGLTFPCEGTDGIRWDVTKRVAHAEWMATSERYRRMQSYLVSEGKLVGRPPWGYTVTNAPGGHKMLVPTEDGRRYIPQIYSRCIAGESMNTIAAWLDSEGILPTAGANWHPPLVLPHWWGRSLAQLIRCTTYAGRRQDKSGRTIHKCEPLIDALTFRLAGEALTNRPKKGPSDPENKPLLSQVLHCPRCEDSPMYRLASGREDNPVYRCSGRGTQRRGCGNSVPVVVADNLVSEVLLGSKMPVMASRVVPGDNHKAELEDVEAELRSLPVQGLSEDEEDRERARLRRERKRLQALPATPDRVVRTDTGRTHGEVWDGLEGQQRGEYLRHQHISIYAIRSELEPIGPLLAARDVMPDQASVVSHGGTSVAVCWLDA